MNELELITITPEVLNELEDAPGFENAHNVKLGDAAPIIRDVSAQMEEFRESIDAPPEWVGYLSVDVETRIVIGTCAFKGEPDEAGCVEIAYFTFAPYERRGYGTAMARALIGIASQFPAVSTIVAHTLKEENASTHILTGLGFTQNGEDIDEDEGPVWRWERPTVLESPLPG